MVGSQIRLGGINYPYRTIVAVISPTSLVIDQPWVGPDQTNQAYQILQIYYPVPSDFGYFEVIVSLKDAYRVYHQATEAELDLYDPQRTNQGSTYGAAFYDFSPNFAGTIGPVVPVTNPVDPAPTSTTTFGFSYPANSTYIIQVVSGGISGVATWQWLRSGQNAFQPVQTTSDQPQDLSDGVQVFWSDGVNYVTGDLFVINCVSIISQSVPRIELWPAPTYQYSLYTYIYFRKELDISYQNPQLPPPVASRGEMLLEMALEKAATFPGADMANPNPYYSLALANRHRETYEDMLIDFSSNDQNLAISNLSYDDLPFLGPWATGRWQQSHSPYLS